MSKFKVLAKGVEYYTEDDMVLLIRCPKCGKENYALAVASGRCCWCGFDGRELLTIAERAKSYVEGCELQGVEPTEKYYGDDVSRAE